MTNNLIIIFNGADGIVNICDPSPAQPTNLWVRRELPYPLGHRITKK
jgi:hypothetical protein